MSHTSLSDLERLSDDELTERLRAAARLESGATAALVAHLAEFDGRRLPLRAGSASLYAYCTEVLRLSEHTAYGRSVAARVARRFPRLLDYLANGRITLTAVVLVAGELNGPNHVEILDAVTHRSRRDIESWLAGRRPAPPVVDSVRRLAEARGTGAAVPGGSTPTGAVPLLEGVEVVPPETGTVTPPPADPEADPGPPPAAPTPAGAPARQERISPLDQAVYRVQFTARAETYRRLMQVRELLRHRIPDGDLGAIFDRALRLLYTELARRKFALVQGAEPRSAGGVTAAGPSRYIPAAVRRAVWLRDDGRCAFVGEEGRRCAARGRLEYHHRVPFARGGPATVENLELRCQAHNLLEEERPGAPPT